MEKLRIVFMGTPDFAVGILDAILKNEYEIVGVVTVADKPAGRGQKIQISAVKEYALQHNLPILQPTNLKDETFLSELKSLNANLQVVVAFRMLPKVVWEMPKFGTFNLHASLLPQYRGAAPINWAIINGETVSGVTTFFIDDKIDTGEIILQDEINILPEENAGVLHDRLMHLGSKTVIDTLILIENGNASTIKQNENESIKTAYKLNKENCQINWKVSGSKIHNLIRGLSPYPAAWTILKNGSQEWQVKIYESVFENEIHNDEIGQIFISKKELKVAVLDGYLFIKNIQFPGKKRMTIQEFLNGVKLTSEATFY